MGSWDTEPTGTNPYPRKFLNSWALRFPRYVHFFTHYQPNRWYLPFQISCGQRHTLAFVPTRGRLYAFGLGGSGQLGGKKTQNSNTPQVVQSTWSADGIAESGITMICAGGDQSFCVTGNTPPADYRLPEKSGILPIKTLTADLAAQISAMGASDDDAALDQDFLEEFETVFSSPQCLNASLLQSDHMPCLTERIGVDLKAWQDAFECIGSSDRLTEVVEFSVSTFLPELSKIANDPEAIRVVALLPLLLCSDRYLAMWEAAVASGGEDLASRRSANEAFERLHTPFCASLCSLGDSQRETLKKMLMRLNKHCLRAFVRAIKVRRILSLVGSNLVNN